MNLFIQNMVSLRCKLLVKSELEKLGIPYISIKLGEVQLKSTISKATRKKLMEVLHESGLELICDKKSILIENIIILVIEKIHYTEELPKVNFSSFLSDKLQYNYHYIAEIFSKTKGITLEHFIILHKVERIKELIIYDELNITEISYKMNYSSVGHLSKQFKKVTGFTATFFKNHNNQKRKNIEHL